MSIRGIDMCAFLQELLQLSLQQIVALTYYCIKWDGKICIEFYFIQIKKRKRKRKILISTVLNCWNLEMIWKCRNQVVHEGRVFYVEVEDLIRSLVKVFNEHWSCIKTRTVSPSSARLLIWQKPAQDRLKMYCDAAVGMEHSYVAVVVRDWRRTLVFTWSKKVNTKVPVQAEAKAFLWAVQLASQMHPKKVIQRIVFKQWPTAQYQCIGELLTLLMKSNCLQ